jgi:hypothetical protein
MKTGRKPFLILLSLFSTRGAEAISTEEFSRIRDEGQRTYIIEHAPQEQKEELKKRFTPGIAGSLWSDAMEP